MLGHLADTDQIVKFQILHVGNAKVKVAKREDNILDNAEQMKKLPAIRISTIDELTTWAKFKVFRRKLNILKRLLVYITP